VDVPGDGDVAVLGDSAVEFEGLAGGDRGKPLSLRNTGFPGDGPAVRVPRIVKVARSFG
jgi:hypothetical protein